ncbi:nucleotidylyl transferase superfamily protein [Striga asiatica]|uniref:Nucleotidylyl transferase superfamily protein n=1 Tax=Striga asiatica TaxID=4170 RepID=A0A5A7Q216_STRAF|nr:nucleotidylyl transferase superfamily protein [Striga asiatica]
MSFASSPERLLKRRHSPQNQKKDWTLASPLTYGIIDLLFILISSTERGGRCCFCPCAAIISSLKANRSSLLLTGLLEEELNKKRRKDFEVEPIKADAAKGVSASLCE